jgi:predicted dienelactone hydrolase
MSIRYLSALLFGIFLLSVIAACSSGQTPATSTTLPTVATASPATIQETKFTSPTGVPEPLSPSPTAFMGRPTPEPYILPLTEYGPKFISKRKYSFEDSSRGDRQVSITVWYPAIKPEGFTGTSAEDAEPDPAGAPYPVILSSTKVARSFAPHLVTHGFAVVSVDKIDTYTMFDNTLIDMPLDLLFALNQAASNSFQGLEGILDTEHVGAMGYSFDGYNSLAISGARVDPEHYLTHCTDPTSVEALIYPSFIAYQCALLDKWDEFAAHAGDAITDSDDGLWQPMTDARILAVMPMAPEGWLLFGERGLQAVDRPVLIIVGTLDELYAEDLLIFENLGIPDRFFISFVRQGHLMILRPQIVDRMRHLALAFFGYYLQGRQDYAVYFTEDFIDNYHDLVWGEYIDE